MIVGSAFVLTSCYTVAQGIEQVKLLSRRVSIEELLKENRETPERLSKLRLVPDVLRFAQERVGMTPGSSYTTYVKLDRPSLSYVVQAAEKRKLKMKTWWFPIVGNQPYLGFFDKQKAIEFQKQLVEEGLDTVMGGVQAFSLLGYFPDPIYSSMVDGNDALEFVALLFHETLHRTVYFPNAFVFNENLAEFVAQHATVMFINEKSALLIPLLTQPTENLAEQFLEKQLQQQRARRAFGEFLNIAKKELDSFYDDPALRELELSSFLKKRGEKFAALDRRFQNEFGEAVKDSSYSRFFQPSRFNNAALLSASVYDARQEPFARLLEKCGSDLAKFLKVVKKCVADAGDSEQEIWAAVESCGG